MPEGKYTLPFLGCQKKKKDLVLLPQKAHCLISSFYLWKKINFLSEKLIIGTTNNTCMTDIHNQGDKMKCQDDFCADIC
jgi:hypothetical protein